VRAPGLLENTGRRRRRRNGVRSHHQRILRGGDVLCDPSSSKSLAPRGHPRGLFRGRGVDSTRRRAAGPCHCGQGIGQHQESGPGPSNARPRVRRLDRPEPTQACGDCPTRGRRQGRALKGGRSSWRRRSRSAAERMPGSARVAAARTSWSGILVWARTRPPPGREPTRRPARARSAMVSSPAPNRGCEQMLVEVEEGHQVSTVHAVATPPQSHHQGSRGGSVVASRPRDLELLHADQGTQLLGALVTPITERLQAGGVAPPRRRRPCLAAPPTVEPPGRRRLGHRPIRTGCTGRAPQCPQASNRPGRSWLRMHTDDRAAPGDGLPTAETSRSENSRGAGNRHGPVDHLATASPGARQPGRCAPGCGPRSGPPAAGGDQEHRAPSRLPVRRSTSTADQVGGTLLPVGLVVGVEHQYRRPECRGGHHARPGATTSRSPDAARHSPGTRAPGGRAGPTGPHCRRGRARGRGHTLGADRYAARARSGRTSERQAPVGMTGTARCAAKRPGHQAHRPSAG